jgi:hypothetical protein
MNMNKTPDNRTLLPKRRGKTGGQPVLPPQQPPSPAKKVINVDLNRKLMTHAIVAQLRETAQAKDMVAGSAIVELLNEYDRMRYILEALVTAYERDDEAKVRQTLDLLRILL